MFILVLQVDSTAEFATQTCVADTWRSSTYFLQMWVNSICWTPSFIQPYWMIYIRYEILYVGKLIQNNFLKWNKCKHLFNISLYLLICFSLTPIQGKRQTFDMTFLIRKNYDLIHRIIYYTQNTHKDWHLKWHFKIMCNLYWSTKIHDTAEQNGNVRIVMIKSRMRGEDPRTHCI